MAIDLFTRSPILLLWRLIPLDHRLLLLRSAIAVATKLALLSVLNLILDLRSDDLTSNARLMASEISSLFELVRFSQINRPHRLRIMVFATARDRITPNLRDLLPDTLKLSIVSLALVIPLRLSVAVDRCLNPVRLIRPTVSEFLLSISADKDPVKIAARVITVSHFAIATRLLLATLKPLDAIGIRDPCRICNRLIELVEVLSI